MAALLVVEDDEDARQLMGRWLERDGHDVSVAGDGQRALDLRAVRTTTSSCWT